MIKFNVDYVDRNGELCHVWVSATNKNQATLEAQREYRDIDHIIRVY